MTRQKPLPLHAKGPRRRRRRVGPFGLAGAKIAPAGEGILANPVSYSPASVLPRSTKRPAKSITHMAP